MKLYTHITFAYDGTVLAEESEDYFGNWVLCKGASAAETNLANSQASFYNTLQADYGTTFANQQNILSSLTNTLSPIVNAGPNQFGYTPGQVNALNTQATTGTAAQYQAAKTAAGDAAAAAGGGNQFLPSGAQAQTAANIATAGAQQESNDLLGIQTAGWNQGTQNFNNAVGQILSASGQESPTSYAGAANTAGTSAFGSANTVSQENNAASPWNVIGGALGGIAGNLLGIPGLGSLGSALGGGSQGMSGGFNGQTGAQIGSNGLSTLTLPPPAVLGG